MNKLGVVIIGVLMGMITLAVWRFATYEPGVVHYHANFAVYVNGERELFASDTYYEETAGCSLDATTNPIARTHMHNKVGDLVHVHAPAVTWGHFFQNLGWGIGVGYVQTRDQLLVADKKHPVNYRLNGERVDNPSGMVIGSEDRLLVSYGTADETELKAQFDSIAATAAEQNAAQDPAGCGGAVVPGWRERLKLVL